MNEKLKEYFKKIESKNNKIKNEDRDKRLLYLKLTDIKELSDEENKKISEMMSDNRNYHPYWYNERLDKHVKYSWNPDMHKYNVIIPIDITAEEYDKLLDLDATSEDRIDKNGVAGVLNGLGIAIFIIGGIAGFIIGGTNSTYGDFNIGLAAICWFSAILSGMLNIGIGEIIQLLNELNRKR